MEINQVLPDFDHPLEMLKACRDRIEAQIETLHSLATHVLKHGCEVPTRQAAGNTVRYFDTAVRLHHKDEELDLFPSMLEHASEQNAERAAMLVAWLTAEHRIIESIWRRLRDPLLQIARGEHVELCARAVAGLALSIWAMSSSRNSSCCRSRRRYSAQRNLQRLENR